MAFHAHFLAHLRRSDLLHFILFSLLLVFLSGLHSYDAETWWLDSCLGGGISSSEVSEFTRWNQIFRVYLCYYSQWVRQCFSSIASLQDLDGKTYSISPLTCCDRNNCYGSLDDLHHHCCGHLAVWFLHFQQTNTDLPPYLIWLLSNLLRLLNALRNWIHYSERYQLS